MDVRAKSICALSMLRRHTTAPCILMAVCCLLLLSSCSAVGRYSPKPSVAEGVAENISSSGDVAVVNAQDSREEHALEFRGIVVDYHEFTQSVVDALKGELERNGVVVRDEANKKLYVKVTKVTMMPGPAVFRGGINATVETEGGPTERFYATRASYASGWNVGKNPSKPLDVAFKDLIKSILANEAILGYIEN